MSRSGFKCIVCGATESRPWLTDCPDYYLQKGGPVNYVECDACSLVQQFPFPDDVSALYADYPVHSSRNTVQRLARRIFQRQVYFRPASGSERLDLLDYGCGDGTFLREMRSRVNAVYGFEPGDAHSVALSSQLNMPIYSSTEKLCRDLAGTLDVITAHFVLEHVSDLRGAFETFRTLLKPGGMLYIAVPNIRSWESRLFKKRWHGLDAPRHLIFPEAGHFKTLAEEYGFGVPQFSFAVFPNTLAASLATVLVGRCQPLLLMGLIVPSWLVALGVPQGTLVVRMIRT